MNDNDGVILDFTNVSMPDQPAAEQADVKKPRRIAPLFNMAVRGALTSGAKLAAGSLVIGFGGSALGAAALGIGVAAGISATWTCIAENKKMPARVRAEYEQRKAKGKPEDKDLTYEDVLQEYKNRRTKKVVLAFAAGLAFGSFGAWLAHSDALSVVFEKAHALFAGADVASAPPVAGSVAAAAAHGTAAAAPADIILPPAIDAPSVDPLAAGLGYANIDSANGVSAQALKDAAHSILRMEDIAPADRIEMARALAQEAAERGNSQAVSFLTDLPKVEMAWGLEPHAAVDAASLSDASTHVAAHAPVAAPVVAAPVEAPAVVAEPSVTQPSLAQTFGAEAASCTVTTGDAGAVTVSCITNSEVMNPGDHITFAMSAAGEAEIVTLGAETPSGVMTADIVDISIADTVARLVAKASAAKLGAAL